MKFTDHKIVTLSPIKLVGLRIKLSLSFDGTAKLWQDFLARLEEISNRIPKAFYSVQVYPENLKMSEFTEHTEFIRWAAVEVNEFGAIPEGMQTKTLTGGKYAVFLHKGPVKTFVQTSNHALGTWLPNSEYTLDDRAHFEILGDKYYGPEHPESEEEMYIPIR
ncbi:MAG: GyrI-like domain-containing protein [Leeuwenhoekiella sp.]